MRKILMISIFSIASMLIGLLFVTSRSYAQLSFAAVLYIPLVYLMFKAFPRTSSREDVAIAKPPTLTEKVVSVTNELEQGDKHAEVTDINKRTFIKFVGAAGLSFLLYSLLGRKIESLFIGQPTSADKPVPKDFAVTESGVSNPSPTNGYSITEIDDSDVAYYGYTNKNEGWIIMREETDTNSFRYTKGEIDFPLNWKNRKNLSYDYFYNIF